MNSINLNEFRDIFNYIIDNNRKLNEQGKKTSAIGIRGEAGCGKTEIVRQIAQSRDMTFVKINVGQLEELGDFLGMPLKQFKIIRHSEGGDIEEWVSGDLLQTYLTLPCESYSITSETRMSYAPPQWLPREENPNGTIIFFDDFNRGAPYFMNAMLEIVDRGEYVSWKLPKNTNIVLSSNPDNGSYNVSALDDAFESRYINFNVDFDIKIWAKWAETARIDGRGINFALTHPEIFENKNGTQVVNARSYVTFCNAISGIDDWSTPESLALILNIAKGCFNDKDNIVGNLFTMFIANRLDKLISPEDMLKEDWKILQPKIKSCVYDKSNQYRPDVASVLHTRLLNYSMYYFDQKGAKTEVVQDRLLELIEASENKDDMLFSEDLIFDIIRTLMKYHPNRTNKFMLNKKIRDKVK